MRQTNFKLSMAGVLLTLSICAIMLPLCWTHLQNHSQLIISGIAIAPTYPPPSPTKNLQKHRLMAARKAESKAAEA
ncbi:hypothetical protein V8C37DRAFT_12664 [Trichoderma ceciliae]